MGKPNINTPIGTRYGRLVTKSQPYTSNSVTWVECRCDCGSIKEYRVPNLRKGNTLSCGCLQKELQSKRKTTHGERQGSKWTAEYMIWRNMKSRCEERENTSWANYGGRGITLCPEWSESFQSFLDDMGRRPNSKDTLERIDNEKGYSPNNCCWASRLTQANNKRTNVFIEYQGLRKTIAEWSRYIGIDYFTLQNRITKRKWDIERALTTPTGNQGKRKIPD